MEEREITPDQSLLIIKSMIDTAKNKLADDGFLTIFWGWLVFGSALLNYILLSVHIVWAGLVWAVLMPLGGIFTAVYSAKENKKKTVKTHVDQYLNYLWIAFGIALALAIFSLGIYGVKSSYFCLMLLYSFVIFVSGALLDFKALRIGALISYAIAAVSLFLPDMEQLLCLAASVLSSYIIPGHLLRKTYKSQHRV